MTNCALAYLLLESRTRVSAIKSQCTVGHTMIYVLWVPNLFFQSEVFYVTFGSVFSLAALLYTLVCMANELA